MYKSICIFLLLVTLTGCGQIPDKFYRAHVANPAYESGKGPFVCLDEGHHNFHTLDNRFWAFGQLLRRDGYIVEPLKSEFTLENLKPCDILVIANAQLQGEWDDYPYPTPSGFRDNEIESVKNWVSNGGALLLIADHMPLAGVSQKLALAFGVEFNNGFALNSDDFDAPLIFQTEEGTLTHHPILNGRSSEEAITSIRTFTGQAFQAPTAEPLLVLPKGYVSLMPEKAWDFDEATKRIPVENWLQGAVMEFESGRAAFFGEAAMFTAQLSDFKPVGMNAPQAEQNAQFILNLMHWLSRLL